MRAALLFLLSVNVAPQNELPFKLIKLYTGIIFSSGEDK